MLFNRFSTSHGRSWAAAVLAASVAAGLAGTASASAIIYQDSFTGSSSATLNGAAPTIDNGPSATWTANDYPVWSDSGYTSLNLDQSTKQRDSAYLGFTPVSGQIYTLSATITLAPADGSGWIALGFPGNIQAGNNPLGNTSTLNTGWDWPADISNVYASPWALIRLETAGDSTYFTGPSTGGGASFPTPAGSNVANALAIKLDTAASAWTYQVFDNGQAVSPVIAFSTNPTITAVGMQNGSAIGTVSNFELTSSPVPEPAALGLVGVGAMGLLMLKRRRNAV